MKMKSIIVNDIAGSNLIPRKVRVLIYNMMGMDDNTIAIYPGCYFSSNNFSIGKNSWVNFNCSFENTFSKVTIGNNCGIAMNVLFCTSTHKIGEETKRAGEITHAPIVIEDGCWIGAGAKILPNVTIKKGCVIASGAVITSNCEPNGLYGGVPAKRIRDLPQNKKMEYFSIY